MHIAIDARVWGKAKGGIGGYLMKLIEALEQISPPPHPSPTEGEGEIRYTIFLRRANFDEYQPKNPRFHKALWNAQWYGIREQLSTYYLLRTTASLIHFPHWNVPFFFNPKIHAFIRHSGTHSGMAVANNFLHTTYYVLPPHLSIFPIGTFPSFSTAHLLLLSMILNFFPPIARGSLPHAGGLPTG